MKTNNITIHAIEISDKAEFNLNCHTFSPSVYRGNYHATLKGNVLILQHKEYDHFVRSFALTYDLSPSASRLFNKTYYTTKAYKIIQRVIQLKAMQLVKEVNKGI